MSSRRAYRILQQFVLISGFSIFSGCEPSKPDGAGGPASPEPAATRSVEATAGGQSGGGQNDTGTVASKSGTLVEATAPARVRLPSGVSYEVLRVGSGNPVADGARIQIHCRGWVADNALERRVFMDTRRGGIPATYQLSPDPLASRTLPQTPASDPDGPLPSLVVGLHEGLLGMKKGEWRRIEVPSALGYGLDGFPALIPRRADLHFEVELVDFSAN